MTGTEREALALLKRAVSALESWAASLDELVGLASEELSQEEEDELSAVWDDPDRTPDFMRTEDE